jgi:ABC-type branched-subunit amino acid transport system substrate-binding protein
LATIGGPFNAGIQAALYEWNLTREEGEIKVGFKHYDDGGNPADSKTLTEQLIHDDGVFAIVGNFAATCVAANLESIKEAEVPMVYAAAGNDILHNDNATDFEDKAIFPVQPLNKTEGRMLILRAFAPVANGGMGATKVGVLSDAGNEASIALLSGINAEKANLSDAQKSNVVVQDVTGTDYSAAVNALKNANCDVVVITSIGANYLAALTAIMNAEYTCKVLTSYNNASTKLLDDPTDATKINPAFANLFNYVTLYSQAWLDVTSADYVNDLYTDDGSEYYQMVKYTMVEAAKGLGMTPEDAAALYQYGIFGFKTSYWKMTKAIYDYQRSIEVGAATALGIAFDAYAMAGYIAGNLFVQGIDAVEAADKPLTRANYVVAMEANEMDIATANPISFANGLRQGVDSFALTAITSANGAAAAAATVHTLTSLGDYRTLIAG